MSWNHRVILPSALVLAVVGGAFGADPAVSESASTQGVLEIRVEGLRDQRGEIAFAIYDSSDTFRVEPLHRERRSASQAGEAWVVEGLPFGDYAVAVYHDRNANGRLDKNKLGIPKEPYAFSNDVRGLTGPPRYERARFEFDRSQTISIRLR